MSNRLRGQEGRAGNTRPNPRGRNSRDLSWDGRTGLKLPAGPWTLRRVARSFRWIRMLRLFLPKVCGLGWNAFPLRRHLGRMSHKGALCSAWEPRLRLRESPIPRPRHLAYRPRPEALGTDPA